ncbi:aldo/keto reductase [Streptomyces sp. NBC_01233]|uniref:aldo/keto reductase n=1 Tax=Streptomyces sp. NBC_01233 TaxID=2903787 RepID=UPI002E1283E8|nr:aldo/keto reductase [Streptomyces sp. NBC_01233]
MNKRVLAQTGIEVSPIGLGTSTWGHGTNEEAAAGQLLEFVRAGGTLLDTANIYGSGQSELIIGKLLGTTVARRDIILATKAGMVGARPPYTVDASAKGLLAELDRSLSRMGVDYVDLWQMHVWDDKTPIEETVSALRKAVTSGRARAVGVCNYSGWQTASAATIGRLSGEPLLASAEVEYSLVQRGIEREVVPAAEKFGIGLLPWAPLGRGVLTGKYRDGVPPGKEKSSLYRWYVEPMVRSRRAQQIVEVTAEYAQNLGVSPGVLALSWVRDRPLVVAPLVGARTVEQLKESLGAFGFSLPPEVRAHLDELSAPRLGYPERIAV